MFHLGGFSGTKSKYLTVNVEFSSAFVVLGFNSDFVHIFIVCKARMTCGLLKLWIKWSWSCFTQWTSYSFLNKVTESGLLFRK